MKHRFTYNKAFNMKTNKTNKTELWYKQIKHSHDTIKFHNIQCIVKSMRIHNFQLRQMAVYEPSYILHNFSFNSHHID